MATGYLARRNVLAQQAGFKNYYEQRKFRAEAQKLGAPKGNDRRAVEARDKLGRELRDYQPGESRSGIEDRFGDIFDEYDINIDFNSPEWYAWLDELSPKKEA